MTFCGISIFAVLTLIFLGIMYLVYPPSI